MEPRILMLEGDNEMTAVGIANLEFAGLRIDHARRTVERDGKTIRLTSLEFGLLYVLASRAGRVFSRESLARHVWGGDRVVDHRSIDTLISRLRRKLEVEPATPRLVQTIWGAGYHFQAEES